MTKLAWIELGQAPEGYAMQYLKGGNSLSSLILNSTNFTKGEFWTILPDTISYEKALLFHQGGLTADYRINSLDKHELQEIVTTQQSLVNFAYNFLSIHSNSVMVIEDIFGKPNSKIIRNSIVPHFIHNEREMYFYLDHDHADKDLIQQAIRSIRVIGHFVAVFALTTSGTDLSIDVLKNHVSCLVIGAYDDESYIFWSSKNDPFMVNKASINI